MGILMAGDKLGFGTGENAVWYEIVGKKMEINSEEKVLFIYIKISI